MHALKVTRAEDFPEWYQAVVREADLAELSPTRGSHDHQGVGHGLLGAHPSPRWIGRIKETGHDNYYFPLLIPLSLLREGSRAR